MNQNNPYMNYSFGQRRKDPALSSDEGGSGMDSGSPRTPVRRISGGRFGGRMRSPVFAGALLLGAGAIFALIIALSYSGDSGGDEMVPVIEADTLAYKETPEQPGGLDIPNRDSTVYMMMRDGEAGPKGAKIENLLAEEEPAEEPVENISALSAEAEEAINAEPAAGGDPQPTTEAGQAESASEMLAAKTDTPKVQTIVQTEEKIPLYKGDAASAGTAELSPTETSPDTLAFVKSVLEKKDGISAAETNGAASIEPAAGAATVSAKAITPGGYYVQLASVTSESGAQGEWAKLQKAYATDLTGLDYRVQRADLDKGTFYRVQAGPMSKESADELCASIKAQKPGGCIVTK